MEFSAAQFHFHSPSEHTIDGVHMDMEMHIVHTKGDDAFAVLGFMFDVTEGGSGENLFIEQLTGVFSSASLDSNGKPYVDAKVSLKGFLDSVDKDEFWSYPGSLTTPPCTEGVRWTVLTEVQPISPAQLQRFYSLWAGNFAFAEGQGNNRIVQELNERTLYLSD